MSTTRTKERSHLHLEQGSSSFVKEHVRNITAASDQRRGTTHPPSRVRPNLLRAHPQIPLTGPDQVPSKYPHPGMSPPGRYSLEGCPRTNQGTVAQWKQRCALHTGKVNASSKRTGLRGLNSRFRSPIFEMSTPSISILPSVASRIRNSASKNEDFPLPVRPQMPTFSFAF